MKKEEKFGVHKLKYGTCEELYMGQTGKGFLARILDHRGRVRRQEIDEL